METKEAVNKRIIDSIKFIISTKYINKSTLADTFSISRSKFSEILNGRMNAGVDIINILCTQFGISAEWLLMGKGDMMNEKEVPQFSGNIIAGDGNELHNIQMGKSNKMNNPMLYSQDDSFEIQVLKKEVEYLKKEVEYLSKALKEKERFIQLLMEKKADNDKLNI